MKELFGTTPNRYILDVMLEVAARLLSEGRLTASEAGYKVGMDNRSYFFKCFKEKYGVPPGKYARGLTVGTRGRRRRGRPTCAKRRRWLPGGASPPFIL